MSYEVIVDSVVADEVPVSVEQSSAKESTRTESTLKGKISNLSQQVILLKRQFDLSSDISVPSQFFS